ncbi:MAG: glycosyltransferase [Candidatus Bathyarchaeota archaeon]|nr:glycosyltransferase [Candidatus Bathyarchaeum sp.]
MKICAVTTWPPHRDGVALYSFELYNQIAKLVDVVILANTLTPKEASESCKETHTTILRCWRRGPWFLFDIFRSVLKTRAHAVHLQHGWLLYGGYISSIFFPVLLLFFRLSRKPCVVTVHTVIRRDAKLYKNSLVNFLARTAVMFVLKGIVKFSDSLIVHNPLMTATLKKEYNTNIDKIAIIPHGVKPACNPNEGQKSKEVSIMSLGFLRKDKGISYLIQAFEKFHETCPDAKLIIVGGSHAHDKKTQSEKFKQLLTPAAQKHVIFTGFVDEKRLEQLIWNSDIIVLQSTEPYYVEASGALATVADYGKPVICSKVPKFQSELQNEEHYLAVASSDSTELAQALSLLIKNEELRKRLGENLRQEMKNRRWSTVAAEHIKLYEQLLKS